MMTLLRSAIVGIGVLAGGVAWRGTAFAAEPEPRPAPDWRVTAQLGTTAVAGNNVLPAPIAIGAGALVEHGWFGTEAAVHADAATICDVASAGDTSCGLLWIFDVAPRATVMPGAPWSPYVAVRFQITQSEPHGVVPALGPRVGLRYRGAKLGFYLEVGPSFVRSREAEVGGFTSSDRRWFPQASTGISFTLR